MALAAHNFTIQDDAGNIVTDVDIEVRLDTVGQPLAQLFSDRDGLNALGNPFTSGTGAGRFHVAGGAYQIRAFKSGFEAIQRYVGIGTANEADVADLIPDIPETAFVYYASLTAALAEDLSAFAAVHVGGYASEGDGGAAVWLNRDTNEPAHGAKRQDGAGNWFELGAFIPSPLMVGADPTGANDSSSAIQEWLDCLIATKLEGSAAGGVYKLDSQVTIALTGGVPFFLKITGAGIDGTEFLVNNATGGIKVTATGGASAVSHVLLQDFRMRPAIQGAGDALYFEAEGSAGFWHRHHYLRNLYIGPDVNEETYFTNGVVLFNSARAHVEHCDIVGMFGNPEFDDPQTVTSFADVGGDLRITITNHGFITGERVRYKANGGTPPTGLVDGATYVVRDTLTNQLELASVTAGTSGSVIAFTDAGSGSAHTFELENWRDDGRMFKMEKGIDASESSFLHVAWTRIGSCAIGIDNAAGAGESITLSKVQMVAVKTGLNWVRTAARGTIWMNDVHVHFRDYGLFFDKATNIFGYNLDLLQTPPAQHAASAPVNLYLDEVNLGVWYNVQFASAGDLRRVSLWMDGDSQNHTFINPSFGGYEDICVKQVGSSGQLNNKIIHPDFATGHTIITSKYDVDAASAKSLVVIGELGTGILNHQVELVKSFDADAAEGPIAKVVRASPSPNAADIIGSYIFEGRNNAGGAVTFGKIVGEIGTAGHVAASENGIVSVYVPEGGSLVQALRIRGRSLGIPDGVQAPPAVTGVAQIYVDAADGDLKVKFADGVTKVLAADT